MLNMAEIGSIVGIAPLTGSEREDTSGVLHPTVSFVRGTNEGSFPLPDTLDSSSHDMFPYGLLARTTGAELRECSGLLYIVAYDVASDSVLTSYKTVHLPDDRAIRQVSPLPMCQSDTLQPKTPPETHLITTQVLRLREITGLTVEHLASIFMISRTTYHKWIDGSPLNDRHKEHLLEILPLVEEASHRLGSVDAVNTWLLTPVSAGGKKPIEYLSLRQYTTFRGFLLRQHNNEELFRPLTPLKYVYQERPREEIEDELERLNPGVRLEEDDTSEVDE